MVQDLLRTRFEEVIDTFFKEFTIQLPGRIVTNEAMGVVEDVVITPEIMKDELLDRFDTVMEDEVNYLDKQNYARIVSDTVNSFASEFSTKYNFYAPELQSFQVLCTELKNAFGQTYNENQESRSELDKRPDADVIPLFDPIKKK